MCKEQLIISVGREFCSGGHAIAEMLAEKFGLPLYDSNLLHEIAETKELDINNLARYDEIPKKKLFSRRIKGHSNSPEENVAHMQFKYLREKAEDGKSFVIVGRCADEILKDIDGLVTIFVLGDMDKKVERFCSIYNVTPDKAKNIIKKTNRKRKNYHNYYCDGKWGDSRNYELSINSSTLGLEKTADMIEMFIKEKQSLRG